MRDKAKKNAYMKAWRARQPAHVRTPEEIAHRTKVRREWASKNRERLNTQQRNWVAAHPGYHAAHAKAHPHYGRKNHLRRKFQITMEIWEQMYVGQNGKCGICATALHHDNWRNSHVDHDHATGRVRKLLCGPCNRGLGSFRDNPNRLELAAKYLRSFVTIGM